MFLEPEDGTERPWKEDAFDGGECNRAFGKAGSGSVAPLESPMCFPLDARVQFLLLVGGASFLWDLWWTYRLTASMIRYGCSRRRSESRRTSRLQVAWPLWQSCCWDFHWQCHQMPWKKSGLWIWSAAPLARVCSSLWYRQRGRSPWQSKRTLQPICTSSRCCCVGWGRGQNDWGSLGGTVRGQDGRSSWRSCALMLCVVTAVSSWLLWWNKQCLCRTHPNHCHCHEWSLWSCGRLGTWRCVRAALYILMWVDWGGLCRFYV